MCINKWSDIHSTNKNTFVHGIDLMIKSGKCQVIARFIQAYLGRPLLAELSITTVYSKFPPARHF